MVAHVYERDHLLDEVRAFHPESILHQLTDLPDDVGRVAEFAVLDLGETVLRYGRLYGPETFTEPPRPAAPDPCRRRRRADLRRSGRIRGIIEIT